MSELRDFFSYWPWRRVVQWLYSIKEINSIRTKWTGKRTLSLKWYPRAGWHLDFMLVRYWAGDPAKLCLNFWPKITVRSKIGFVLAACCGNVLRSSWELIQCVFFDHIRSFHKTRQNTKEGNRTHPWIMSLKKNSGREESQLHNLWIAKMG